VPEREPDHVARDGLVGYSTPKLLETYFRFSLGTPSRPRQARLPIESQFSSLLHFTLEVAAPVDATRLTLYTESVKLGSCAPRLCSTRSAATHRRATDSFGSGVCLCVVREATRLPHQRAITVNGDVRT
jgi:hypothetical protein